MSLSKKLHKRTRDIAEDLKLLLVILKVMLYWLSEWARKTVKRLEKKK